MQNFLESILGQAIGDFQANNLEASEKNLGRVLQMQKDNLPALHIMGLIKAMNGQHFEASNYFKKALALNPHDPSLSYNLAKALSSYGRNLEAIKYHAKAVELACNNFEAWINFGNSLVALGRQNEALDKFLTAVDLNPASESALLNLAECYRQLNNFTQSSIFFDKALLVGEKPHLAWLGKARIQAAQDLRSEAIHSYQESLKFNSENKECYLELALLYIPLQKYQEAIDCYESAYKINPDESFLLGRILNLSMQACSWSKVQKLISEISQKIRAGKKVAHPFTVLSTIDDPDLQLRAAKIWASETQDLAGANSKKEFIKKKDKIRIGYFSCDFCLHATLLLMADLFEKHDKSRFEIFAFSYGQSVKDDLVDRVVKSLNGFYNVSEMSDEQIAGMSRDLGIDIAVDLKGFTYDARPGIFKCRPAPVQVNYLGYPGSMGAEYIDYIIADSVLVPEGSEKFYSEKIAYLPNSYQINDPKREISVDPVSREAMGLPVQGFIFCSFNQHYKISPTMFDVWARILHRVDGSVLWLLADGEEVRKNLRREIGARGINPDRLIFAEKLPVAKHLARMKLGGLFLDTYPCNAHTTASDALWAGLPILTCQGESFSSRVASSLLNAMQLPQLVAVSLRDYEDRAVEMALNPDLLSGIRTSLSANREITSLFDSSSTTKCIEHLYEFIADRSLKKLPSVNILIKS